MLRTAAICCLLAPGSLLAADGWDEASARKTLEWLAKTTPKDADAQKEFFKPLIGKKFAWPVVIELVKKTGYVLIFEPAWPQSDSDEIYTKWRDPKSDDLRDASVFEIRDKKTGRDLAPTSVPWIKKQTRGDPGLLTGTIVRIEMQASIVALSLPDQKKKTLFRFFVTIEGKIGPKE